MIHGYEMLLTTSLFHRHLDCPHILDLVTDQFCCKRGYIRISWRSWFHFLWVHTQKWNCWIWLCPLFFFGLLFFFFPICVISDTCRSHVLCVTHLASGSCALCTTWGRQWLWKGLFWTDSCLERYFAQEPGVLPGDSDHDFLWLPPSCPLHPTNVPVNLGQ